MHSLTSSSRHSLGNFHCKCEVYVRTVRIKAEVKSPVPHQFLFRCKSHRVAISDSFSISFEFSVYFSTYYQKIITGRLDLSEHIY